MNFDIAGLAALLIALVTLYKTFTTGTTEKAKQKSEVTKALQELADQTIERNINLRRRVRNLENQITDMKGDIQLFTILCDRCRENAVNSEAHPEVLELIEKYRKGDD